VLKKQFLKEISIRRPCRTDIKVYYNNILIPLIEELKA
jgi:hypothetical protein